VSVQDVYRKSLNMKLELHGMLQGVLQDRLTKLADAKNAASASAAAASGSSAPQSMTQLLAQLQDVREGKPLPSEVITTVAKAFKDDITLENLPRAQLLVVARYMYVNVMACSIVRSFQLFGIITSYAGVYHLTHRSPCCDISFELYSKHSRRWDGCRFRVVNLTLIIVLRW
jgi:hypothetical protein